MRLHKTAKTAALLVLLTACATPPPATVSPPPGPPLPPPGKDTCGAAAYAHTLGEHYSDVPPAPEGRVFRVVCTTCAMTMDFNAERLNFFYDTTTGRVVRLTCG